MKDSIMTMNVAEFAKRWGIGYQAMRKIIKNNPDFPRIVIGRKIAVITDDADLWVRRNMRG